MPAFAGARQTILLSAGQAAGTTPVLLANPNRKVLVIGNNTAKAFRVDVVATSDGGGIPGIAGGALSFGSSSTAQSWLACPTDAIYVGGFAAADQITIWEA